MSFFNASIDANFHLTKALVFSSVSLDLFLEKNFTLSVLNNPPWVEAYSPQTPTLILFFVAAAFYILEDICPAHILAIWILVIEKTEFFICVLGQHKSI